MLIGRHSFYSKCVACHGDESFQLAAARGVRQYHCPIGNIPPVEGIIHEEVD